jgi:hypothetical protein
MAKADAAIFVASLRSPAGISNGFEKTHLSRPKAETFREIDPESNDGTSRRSFSPPAMTRVGQLA